MAGIIFAKNSGLIDDTWKDTDKAIRSFLMDTDTEKNKEDELVSALFNVGKSDSFAEKLGGMTEFGNFEPVDEGGKAVMDGIEEGFAKLIVHQAFAKSFVSTAEAKEDGNVDVMKMAAANYLKSFKRTRAQFASDALTCGAAAFTFGKKSFDATCADGKALFATDHPYKSISGTQSNVYTDALGIDDTVLNKLANIGRNFKNNSGQPMGYDFDTIMIPSDAPALERLIQKIIGSDHQVGNDYNDVNVSKGKWKLVVNPLWSKGNAATDPYIIMSSQANKELFGNLFYDRVALTVNETVDPDTFNLDFNGRYRAGCGFNAWEHIIAGGFTGGTELA